MNVLEQIEYKGLQIEVQRKAFRRTLSIVLKPGKAPQVRTSMKTTFHAIIAFVDSRETWIRKHLAAYAAEEQHLPKQQLMVGHSYPWLGRQLPLKISLTPLNKNFFSADDQNLTLHLPKDLFRKDLTDVTFAHRELREFYARSAHRYFEQRLAHWGDLYGLRPQRFETHEARSRWGSCHPDGKITLNWRLLVFSPAIIDYVIVHELCHLQHMNHSRHFWNLVYQIMPEAKVLTKELKATQRQSEFLERIRPLQGA